MTRQSKVLNVIYILMLLCILNYAYVYCITDGKLKGNGVQKKLLPDAQNSTSFSDFLSFPLTFNKTNISLNNLAKLLKGWIEQKNHITKEKTEAKERKAEVTQVTETKAKKAAEDTAVKAAEDTAEQTAEDTAEQAAEDTAEQAAEDTTRKTTEDTTGDAAGEAAEPKPGSGTGTGTGTETGTETRAGAEAETGAEAGAGAKAGAGTGTKEEEDVAITQAEQTDKKSQQLEKIVNKINETIAEDKEIQDQPKKIESLVKDVLQSDQAQSELKEEVKKAVEDEKQQIIKEVENKINDTVDEAKSEIAIQKLQAEEELNQAELNATEEFLSQAKNIGNILLNNLANNGTTSSAKRYAFVLGAVDAAFMLVIATFVL